MTLPRVPASAVIASVALGRADDKDELETIWKLHGCDSYRGSARRWLLHIYQQQCVRIEHGARALRLARAL